MSRAPQRFPGFDGLRLLAAGCVVFSHAFLVATGTEDSEPFVGILGPGNIVGLYAVYTFFIISGFLLAHSLTHDPSPVRFAISRTLRIYPGFIFCIFVTALLLGPIGSLLEWRNYVGHPDVLRYVTMALTCVCDAGTLPGVYGFPPDGGIHNVVNASLWSLRYEVLTYLLLLWLWLASRNITIVAAAFAVLAAIGIAIPDSHKVLPGVMYMLPYFAGGVAMYVIYRHVGLQSFVAAACVALLLVCAVLGWQRHAYALLGAYVIVFLGTRANIGSALIARTGDLSYGVYLFGWPVEQLVREYTHTASPWLVMALSAPIVLMFAALSFYIVEGPALRLRKPIASLAARLSTWNDPSKQRAARIGATLAFLAAAALILTSKNHWWYATTSFSEIVLWSVVGATAAMVVLTAYRLSHRQLGVGPSPAVLDGQPPDDR